MKRIAFEDLELGPVIGTGTVGTVYRSTLKPDGIEVAVKILQDAISNDALVRQRFRREMAILSRLVHPHIIKYYGGGEHDGQLYFAMELQEAGNARDLLDRYGNLSWQEVASIGRQICSALQYAHNQGIIHRDLKPGNLFLDGEANVKLGDFGIARDTQAADITSQGLTVGTHAYMAPEQITAESLITGKADLYSLGCVMFELLTGRKLFEGTNFAVLFEQHLKKTPPRVTEFVQDCPDLLADVIDQLLRKSPDDRPFNARVVQGELNELLATSGASMSGKPVDEGMNVSKMHDVGADTVIDVGMLSLQKKIHPEARPELTWKAFALLGALICTLVIIAMLSSQ